MTAAAAALAAVGSTVEGSDGIAAIAAGVPAAVAATVEPVPGAQTTSLVLLRT